MSALPILDLVAGIIFIYFLLAIVNNAIIEVISASTKIRSADLKQWLEQTFNKVKTDGFANEIVNHPLLTALSPNGKATSYFDPKNFASALVQIIWASRQVKDPLNLLNLKNIKKAIEESPSLPDLVKETLSYEITKIESHAGLASNQIELFEEKIAHWYDGIMERISSRFKRIILKYTLFVSFGLTLALNVDTLSLASYFYAHPHESTKWAGVAYASLEEQKYKTIVKEIGDTQIEDSASKPNLDSLKKVIKNQKEKAQSGIQVLQSGLPLGWNQQIFDSLFSGDALSVALNLLKKVLGLAITVFAMAMGAPFWFDVLSKVANIRSVIKPKNK